MTMTPPTTDSEDGYATDSSASSFNRSGLLNPELESTPSPHPFAASTKANRAPPLYEKKSPISPTISYTPRLQITPRVLDFSRTDSENISPRTFSRVTSQADAEHERWERAITDAVDRAETSVELSSQNLTYIPPSILHLKDLVVLPDKIEAAPSLTVAREFSRSITAPALLPSPDIRSTRAFGPIKTTGKLPFGRPRALFSETPKHFDLRLFLSNNSIRKLPRELFALNSLVVLTLRKNKLTSLPPAIGQLRSLRELNIGNNRIQYLPSEIQSLALNTLYLHPNPFIPSPPDGKESSERLLAPLRRATPPADHCPSLASESPESPEDPSPIPSLTEYCIRGLLSLDIQKARLPKIETFFPLSEIDNLALPSHVQEVIRASTGHGKPRLNEHKEPYNAEQDVTANICPGHGGAQTSVFYQHVEERMEWVGTIAGVNIAESRTGWVPIRWRGCSHRCLNFLDPVATKEVEDELFEAGKGEDGEEFEFSDDE
ncbi:hypothetical protein M422DRAFT_240110 [Sphaerobolus stellatus SS14]|nr:hypothetical protein M422DRAFT_240110 [Sphaerobolus stellatus SS14]